MTIKKWIDILKTWLLISKLEKKVVIPPVEEVLFVLGSLTVYTLRTPGDNSPIFTFYWRDKTLPGEYGPFMSLYQAMDQYRTVMQAAKTNVVAINNVVKVDFVSKKRLQ